MLRDFVLTSDVFQSAVCAVRPSPLTHPPAAGALSRGCLLVARHKGSRCGRGQRGAAGQPSPPREPLWRAINKEHPGEGGAKRRVRGLARGKTVIIRLLTISSLAMLTGCSAAEQPLERLSDAPLACGTAPSPDSDWRPGCATRRNLAALAEDPRDLERPRQEAPRDAMRRDAVISQYGQSRSTASATAASAPNAAKAQP